MPSPRSLPYPVALVKPLPSYFPCNATSLKHSRSGIYVRLYTPLIYFPEGQHLVEKRKKEKTSAFWYYSVAYIHLCEQLSNWKFERNGKKERNIRVSRRTVMTYSENAFAIRILLFTLWTYDMKFSKKIMLRDCIPSSSNLFYLEQRNISLLRLHRVHCVMREDPPLCPFVEWLKWTTRCSWSKTRPRRASRHEIERKSRFPYAHCAKIARCLRLSVAIYIPLAFAISRTLYPTRHAHE